MSFGKARREKNHDVDMTVGNSFRHLLLFSLPLVVGNLFQQLYNMVDTWVVGNYVSNEAFSAVGTVGPVLNTLVGLFLGLASGAGVVISQYYGAKRFDRVQTAVHTSIVLTLILGVAFTIIGIFITPLMVSVMNTPPEVVPESRRYLTICFAGIMGMLLYNMGAGILRAVGDSRRPFYYLVVATLVNIGLDLLFVLRFHMGVEGVAYATIIAQGASAALTLITLARSTGCTRLHLRLLRIDFSMLRRILEVGIPSALQLAVTFFSNVFVQSYINRFGADCMSGWTAYSKLDQLVYLPMQSIALAATTFVGQNLGVGQMDRAKKGVRIALLMSMVCTVVIILFMVHFAAPLVAFFNHKAEVIEYGTLFVRYMIPFFVICCLNQIYAGALRGAGDSRAPMIIMLLSFVAFRQCYLFAMSRVVTDSVLPLAMGYPLGWLVCSAALLIYYRKIGLRPPKYLT